MSVIVLCPTRGRPDNAWEVQRSLDLTAGDPDTQVHFIVDDDDARIEEYRAPRMDETVSIIEVPHGVPGMAAALDRGLASLMSMVDIGSHIVGFVGDDHRFRTKGWDLRFIEWAQGHPVSMMYANDGARMDIPTQCFMTGRMVLALGAMVPPPLRHLYIDDYWAQLGAATGVIHPFPDLLIEHMHPFFGKAEMDEGYIRVNQQKVYDEDQRTLRGWHDDGYFARDVERVRAAL